MTQQTSVALLAIAGICFSSSAYADMNNARFALHRKDKFSASKSIPTLCDNPATSTIEPNYSPNFVYLPCNQYTINGPALGPSQVYIVLGEAGTEGVCGVSFGIDYDGRDPDGVPATGDESGIVPTFVTWTPCADGPAFSSDGGFGDFPKPKGGLRITWNYPNSCQYQEIGGMGVHAVIGSLYVYSYSPDILRVTPNNNLVTGSELAIADCKGGNINLLNGHTPDWISRITGRVQFGVGTGGQLACWSIHEPISGTPITWGGLKTRFEPR